MELSSPKLKKLLYFQILSAGRTFRNNKSYPKRESFLYLSEHLVRKRSNFLN